MSIRVQCQCGTSYELKEEFAGRLVRCPQCGRENRAPASIAVTSPPSRQPQSVFDRDVFLLRQQLLKISEKYDVCDEQGNKIVFVERPAHLARGLLAIFGGLIAGTAVATLFGMLSSLVKGSPLESVFVILAVVGFLVAMIVVAVVLSAKRHVGFYRDAGKGEKLLEVLQDKKWQPITATYTVTDAAGQPIARLAKNYLYNFFRKRWCVYGPNGELQYTAKEDSAILSLLRRVIGPLFGALRTNFIIVRGDSEDIVGEFNRKFTILDRYVLDLKADAGRTVDRRLALALGVMLDTGERR